MRKNIRTFHSVLRKKIGICSTLFILISSFGYAKGETFGMFKSFEPFSEISVGTRTGDTTGIVTISNSGIQQSLVSAVQLFDSCLITNEEAKLSVNTSNTYLIFKLRRPSGDTATVAFQLVASANNTLVFRPHSGSVILFFVGFGGCVDCKFIRGFNKTITGSTSQGCNQVTSGCRYSVLKS